MKLGPKKMRIDDEAEFVDQEVLTKVLDCKTVFDNLEDKELRTARTRSNPFETIRGGIFQVRYDSLSDSIEIAIHPILHHYSFGEL